MQKEEINILIVDDDAAIGKAMKEAFSKAGFKATHVTKPDDALAMTKLQPVHAAVIDCMLPKMNGRQLAKKLREQGDLPVLLISGIYKDKNFAREAIQETGAIGFFTKPFELPDIINTLEGKLVHLIDAQLAPMQTLLTKDTASHKERIRMLNETGEIHAFELPMVFSLLMHPRVNGHLNIVTADGEVCGVGFHKGNIVQVNQKDAKSYFGILMVERGFITQDEIEEVMKVTGKTKKMGERLVEANVLSPHAIQIVMAEQQGLRLSKTVAETSVKINFLEDDEIREDAVIDRSTFTDLLNDWLTSKLSVVWLKSYYRTWTRYNLKPGPEYSPTARCLTIPVIERVPGLAEKLLEAPTLEQALTDLAAPEEQVYPALHALLVSRYLRFGEATGNAGDAAMQKKRLSKLYLDLEKQNYFERLGLSPKAKDVEIKRAYHDVAKVLHPDKLARDTTADVRELTKQCFAFITVAHETLSDPTKKTEYIRELEQGRAEFVLQAEQLTQSARPLLTKGDFKKAREMMAEAVSLCPPTSEARLLHMWAKLKAAAANDTIRIAAEVRDELALIPPEDRHIPVFYLVKGLQLRATGDMANARKNFEHAMSLDPDFIDAKREMTALKSSGSGGDGKPVDLLKGDLKDVVGMLFKKKR
ncbi:MAG TPA: response regulator [Bdellovibrionales bacterium]|nr:response regulator [Bdellovibrionales bacterium]